MIIFRTKLINNDLSHKSKQTLYILVKFFIERMFSQRRNISQNDKFHPCTCYCHIHSSQVIQETDLSFLIGPYKTYKYHIALLSLETIHGIDCNILAIRLEPCILAYQLTEILHLCLVWGNHPHIYALVKEAFAAYLLYILLQFAYREFGFLLVYTTIILAYCLFIRP